MARVKLNSLLADIRGRLGSVVFSSNAAGFTCSVYHPPVNPQTPSQSASRSVFSLLISSWNLLSPADRALWAAYSARPDNERLDFWGDPYYPSSRAQFISLNTARLQAGMDILETPPTSDLPLPLPAFEGCVYPGSSASDSFLNPLDSFHASIAYVHASVSLSYSPGRVTRSMPFKFIDLPVVGYSWPYLFTSFLSSSFGPVLSSGSYWFQLYPVSSDFRFGTAAYYSSPIGEEFP